MDQMTLDGRESDDGDLFDTGGMPLTDHYAERQLIGYLIHKSHETNRATEVLRPDDLHDPLNRRIYELIIRACETDTSVGIEMLIAGIGGEKSAALYIVSLMGKAELHIDVADVANYLQELSERRSNCTDGDIDFDHGKPFVSKFGAQFWEDIGIAGAAKSYAWLVEYIIPFDEITLAYGDPGSGKSFAMFFIAMCIARNLKFYEYNVEHGLIIYVAAEAGKGFAKRKIAYLLHNNLEPSEPLPFVLLTKRPDFFSNDNDLLELIEEIKQICRRFNVPLVGIFIDTLSAIAPGMNENASQDVSMVRKRLVILQEVFHTAICLVHHKPKDGNGPRGHGSLTGDFETTIEFGASKDRFRATVRKQREGKKGLYWEFTLPVIEVGTNKWGNPETSCVMQPCGGSSAPSKEQGFHPTPTELEFLKALWDSIIDHGEPPPMALPKSIGKVVNYVHVRSLMKQRSVPDGDDEAADGRFRVAYMRAARKLRDASVIGILGNYFWYTGKSVEGFSGPEMT